LRSCYDMADGIDNFQVCPARPEVCHPASAPIRPDPDYGMGTYAPMLPYPPIYDIIVPPGPPPPPPGPCDIALDDGAIDTFECYDAGPAVVLEEGTGFYGQWNGRVNFYGLQSIETWDAFSRGWSGVEDIQPNA
jgi:hypothetical protein